MITFEQALNSSEFHVNGKCTRTIGPRGGVKTTCEVWRRNGKTLTWKTRPGAFRIPVKYGMKSFDYIVNSDCTFLHAAEDCPLSKTEGEVK